MTMAGTNQDPTRFTVTVQPLPSPQSISWSSQATALLYIQANAATDIDYFLICDDQNNYQILACSYQSRSLSWQGVCQIGPLKNAPTGQRWATYLMLSIGGAPYVLAYEPQAGAGAIYALPNDPPLPSSPPPSGSLPPADLHPIWSGQTLGAGWTALAAPVLGSAAGLIAYNAQSGELRSFMIADPQQGPQQVGESVTIAPGQTHLLCCQARDTPASVLVSYNQHATEQNLYLYQIGAGGEVQPAATASGSIQAGYTALVPGRSPDTFLVSYRDTSSSKMIQKLYLIAAADQVPIEQALYEHAWEDAWNLVAVPAGQPHWGDGSCDQILLYFLGYDDGSGSMDIMGIIPPPCGD